MADFFSIKPKHKLLFRFIVSFGCLIWVAYRLPRLGLKEFATAGQDVRPGALVLTLVLTVALLFTRLLRLRCWVDGIGGRSLPLAAWVDLYLKSTALGAVTPARIGDFSRIALLAGTDLALASRVRLAFLEKLADAFYLPLALMVAASTLAAVLSGAVESIQRLATGLLVSLLAGFVFLKGRLRQREALLGLGLTFLGFVLYCGLNIMLFRAAGANLSAVSVVAVAVGSGLVATLPISAGGLGLREGTLVIILERFGVKPPIMVMVICCELLVNLFLPLALLAGWRLFATDIEHDA